MERDDILLRKHIAKLEAALAEKEAECERLNALYKSAGTSRWEEAERLERERDEARAQTLTALEQAGRLTAERDRLRAVIGALLEVAEECADCDYNPTVVGVRALKTTGYSLESPDGN